MAIVAPLVGEMLGVKRAQIDVHDDGLRHSVRIGEAIDFEMEERVIASAEGTVSDGGLVPAFAGGDGGGGCGPSFS
jgi:hypothetical protein